MRLIVGRGEKALSTYLNADSGLIVLVGGEDLGLLGGHRTVTGDDLGHHAAGCLDTHRQRAHIHQQQVLGLYKDTAIISVPIPISGTGPT